MQMIEYDGITDMYRDVLQSVIAYGDVTSPRGKATRELTGVSFTLTNSRKNLLVSEDRKLNYFFSVAEWLWMVLGQNDVASIVPFNSILANFANGEFFDGAYGPKIVEQLPYVIDALRQDPSSRQAVINIWRERPRSSQDVPCTLSMQFLLRDKELRCVTTMRSNDAWRGLPYDVYNFTQTQAYVAAALNVVPGRYTHNVGSLHVYDEDIERAEVVVANTPLYLKWDPQSPVLTYPIPPAVRSYFNEIARRGEYFSDLTHFNHWAEKIDRDVPKPWSTFLRVLMIRWGKTLAISTPWDFLLGRCCNIKMRES
jgi:thymidylate synthase